MEYSREFLVSKEGPKDSTVDAMMQYAMGKDLDSFTPDQQRIVQNYSDGMELREWENQILTEAKKEWWERTLSIPYTSNKSARRAELQTHLGMTAETAADRTTALKLQSELSQFLKRNGLGDLAELRKKYEAEYSDQLEAVMAFFGVLEVIQESKRMERTEYKTSEEVKNAFISLTEHNFTITHFILHNGEDKVFLERFWVTLKELTDSMGKAEEFEAEQRGILTQVAVYKLLEATGTKASLSFPREDALNSIDLWAEQRAVQIKSSRRATQPSLQRTEEVSFPGARLRGDQRPQRHFNSKEAIELAKFRTKLAQYNEATDQHIEGYVMIIPSTMIDTTTGDPTPELVSFMQNEFKKLEPPEHPVAMSAAA